MSHLFGGGGELGWTALKALLLYVTAIAGFRLGERRTLAEMSPFDFVAAVAVGAIVGRVPNSDTTSYLEGAITLVTLLAAHRLFMWLRFRPGFARLIEHPPRVLVTRGQVHARELRRCGLTREDLHSLLRQQGVGELESVRYAIYEKRGQLSVIREGGPDGGGPPPLVRDVVARS